MAKLLFLQNFDYEFMGPMYIASMLRAHGHEARLRLGGSLADFQPTLETFRPDLVGFCVISGSHRWAMDMARQIKREYGIRNVFGGPHATFFPDFIKEEGVDIVVKGEGEDAALDIMDRLEEGRDLEGIPNVATNTRGRIKENEVRPLRQDLDDYPFPDRGLYRDLQGRIDLSVRNVLTSRGCPFNCSFCFEITMREMYKGKGKYVRIRKIDKIIEELLLVKGSADAKTLFFCDDLFGMDKDWLYEFLPVYRREIGLPFTCQVRADIVASEEKYARALRDGLCLNVSMGVESGNEELRNKVLNKKLADSQIVRAAEYLHRAEVPFRTYNVMGLPGETLEDAWSTVGLNVKIRTDYPWCALFLPLPGTQLTQYALDHGQLDPAFDTDALAPSYFASSRLHLERKREIENLHKFFQTVCTFPRLAPLVKILIRLPQNVFFKLWFALVYFYYLLKTYNMRFWPTLKFSLHNMRKALEL